MNIVLINHYAGSRLHGMEFRPYYLAREWVRSGHKVTILAASFSHVRARQPAPGVGRWWLSSREEIDGIGYRWYRTPGYAGNGLGRVANIAAFLSAVRLRARALAHELRPDVVIASSTYPMDIWVARRVARTAGARLVFEVHDLWPLSPIELGGMSPRHPFIRLCQAAEDAAYAHADVVVSMLPKVAQYMSAHGLDPDRLAIVPNGISPDEWQGPMAPLDAPLARWLAEKHDAGFCVVGYAGSHGVPNALGILVEAAAKLREEPFAFVLVGDGMEKRGLEARVAELRLDNVAMFAPIPKAQVRGFLAALDIAYIGWNRVPIYRFGIAPNKLMDYMMAGCPVLHSVEAGNDPVAEAGCGLTVEPESADAVARGLRQLAAVDREQQAAMGRRGREFVLANHSYPVLARRFIDAIPA